MSNTTPDIAMLAASFEERLQKVTLSMRKTFLELPRDHILCQMACDEASAKHVSELVAEAIGSVLRSDRERELISLQDKVGRQSVEITTLTSSLNETSLLLGSKDSKLSDIHSQLTVETSLQKQSELRISELEGKLLASEQSLIQLSGDFKHVQSDILNSLNNGSKIDESSQRFQELQRSLSSINQTGQAIAMLQFNPSSSQILIQNITQAATLGIEAVLQASTSSSSNFIKLQLEQQMSSIAGAANQLLSTHKKLKNSLKDAKKINFILQQEQQQQTSSLEIKRLADGGQEDRMRRTEAALKHREKDFKNLETFYNNKISSIEEKNTTDLSQWKDKYNDVRSKLETAERLHQQQEDHSKLESMVTSQLNTFLKSMDTSAVNHHQQQQPQQPQPFLHSLIKPNTSDHHITKVQHLEELHQLESTILADSRRYIHQKEHHYQERLDKETLKVDSLNEKIQKLTLDVEKHINEKQLIEQAVAMVKGELQLETERNRSLATLHEQQEYQLRDNATRIEDKMQSEISILKEKLTNTQANSNKALTSTEREDIVSALVSSNLITQTDSQSSDIRLLIRKVTANASRDKNLRASRIIHSRGVINDKIARLRSAVLATSTIVNSQINEFSINFERLTNSVVTAVERDQQTSSSQWDGERLVLERDNSVQVEKNLKNATKIRVILSELTQYTDLPDALIDGLTSDESDIQFNSYLRQFSQNIRTNITTLKEYSSLQQINKEQSDNVGTLQSAELVLRTNLESTTNELSILKEKNIELENKNIIMEEQRTSLDNIKSQLTQEISDEKQSSVSINKELSQTQNQLSDATAKLQTSEIDLKASQEKCGRLETENAVSESEITHLKVAIGNLKTDLDTCKDQLQHQQSTSEITTRQSTESYKELQLELNHTKQDLESQLREKEQTYNTQLSQLADKAEEQELSRILPLHQRIAVLEQQITREQLRVTEIEGTTKETFQNEIETLRDEVSRLEREIIRSQRDKQQLLQRISDLDSEHEDHLVNIQSVHKANVQRLQSEASLNEKLISENSDKDKEIAKLLLKISQRQT